MQRLAIVALLISALSPTLVADVQYRLKTSTTVDILEDGKVTGTRKLKAGTIVTVDEAAPAKDEKPAAKAKGKKLVPADISPIMFKTTRPATGATLRAELKLSDNYYGQFEAQRAKFWSVDVWIFDAEWKNSELFNGYISKSTPTGKKLAELIKDGETHRSVVKVTFAKDDTFDDLLLIQDFEQIQPDAT